MVKLLWDVRSALEQGEAEQLQRILDKNRSKDSYYIFKHSNWTNHDCNEMKSTYMLMSRKPPKMLGTVLWLVDNTKGTITKEWELPFDSVCFSEFLDPHNPQEFVHESAKDISGVIQLS